MILFLGKVNLAGTEKFHENSSHHEIQNNVSDNDEEDNCIEKTWDFKRLKFITLKSQIIKGNN